MSYADDCDDEQQREYIHDHNAQLTEFEEMLQCFGIEDWDELSHRERANYKWNWIHVQKRKGPHQ